MIEPLVSILINNYNYGRFLREAIDSALNQTYENIEVIVVDDGSTDNSREIIASYGSRVIPVLKENRGQGSAFNVGFEASSGQWIALLDSDDVFAPEKIARLVDCTYQYPVVKFAAHNLQHFDRHGSVRPKMERILTSRVVDCRAVLKRRGRTGICLPATSGLFFDKHLLRQILPMPEDICITADNYIKAAALSLAPVLLLSEPLARQRLHDNNLYTGQVGSESGKVKYALIAARESFFLKLNFPDLAIFAWKQYGYALHLLRASKCPDASNVYATVRSRYSVIDPSFRSRYYVGAAFARSRLREFVPYV